ncbi:MAG: SigB/SigF/SigG family RNA polymerase sigma factor [Candidatus Omnitrophota bacterium]
MAAYQIYPVSGKVSKTTEELFIKLHQTKDSDIRQELILRHRGLVRQLAMRFNNKGKSLETLISAGNIGLINAVDRYDLSREVKFTTYATHCIIGEIKRYFRDKGWVLKVPRNLKELNPAVQAAIEKLTAGFGHSPTTQEIAQELDLPSETVIEAIEAGRAYRPYSLEQRVELNGEDSICFLDTLSHQDQESFSLFDKIGLKEAIKSLNKREQVIIQLFYFEDYSQDRIAQRLGISQMHISRLLRGAIRSLREILVATI